jgi:hypothetical protein
VSEILRWNRHPTRPPLTADVAVMSLDDVFRNRHYEPGYVYIAGSLSGRVIKIGTTINIGGRQQNKLRNLRYGGMDDWVLLYYVWVDQGGDIEHAARAQLQRYKIMRMYSKLGHGRKLAKYCNVLSAWRNSRFLV